MFAVNIGNTQKENHTSRAEHTQRHKHAHTYTGTHRERERVTKRVATQITIQMVCFDENEFSRLLSIVWHGS